MLKAEAVAPAALREWAVARERAAAGAAERERAEREIEFAELYARHDRILREAGSLDGGDLVLELGKLLARPRRRRAPRSASAFAHVLVDELEDAGRRAPARCSPRSRRTATSSAPAIPTQAMRRFRGAGEAAPGGVPRRAPGRGRGRARPRRCATRGAVRFWRCENDRAQAQAVAREIEHLLAAGEVRPERDLRDRRARAGARARLVAAALEERSVPFRFAGDAAFFQRPEVRDALAWLRMLADPGDAAAVVRALTRPPVELRSVDLAKVTTIARRRKLDMVSALEAALESPQLPPEARDRIQAFLRLHRAAANALEQMRADVFVRRLIERVGLRRHRLFAASPETAERLVNLSRLAELAADWSRREPRGSVRDFVRHLTAVADAGELGGDDCDRPAAGRGAGRRARAGQGARVRPRLPARPAQRRDRGAPLGGRAGSRTSCSPRRCRSRATSSPPSARLMLAHVAMTRAREALVLSWPERPEEGTRGAVAHLPGGARAPRRRGGAPRGGAVRPGRGPALDLPDAARRGARGLVAGRLGALGDAPRHRRRRQRRGRPLPRAGQARGADPAPGRRAGGRRRSRRSTSCSAGSPRPSSGRRSRPRRSTSTCSARSASAAPAASRSPRGASRRWSSSCPAAGAGSALSASDIDLYRTCPLKYKFARVFAIPQEPTINQRFGILIHNVLERFHAEEMRAGGRPRRAARGPPGQPRPAARRCSRPAGAARASAPPTTSSSTATARSPRSPATRSATRARTRGRSGWSATSPSRSARTSCAAASTASTACPTAATS